jgi:hypothetical protein
MINTEQSWSALYSELYGTKLHPTIPYCSVFLVFCTVLFCILPGSRAGVVWRSLPPPSTLERGKGEGESKGEGERKGEGETKGGMRVEEDGRAGRVEEWKEGSKERKRAGEIGSKKVRKEGRKKSINKGKENKKRTKGRNGWNENRG